MAPDPVRIAARYQAILAYGYVADTESCTDEAHGHNAMCDRLRALTTNLALLAELGTVEVAVGWCPDCGNPVFADPDTPFFVCGYCGAGPFVQS